MTPLYAANHLLDRMAHTLRILGAVELPPVPVSNFTMPPPFETGLSMALRAVRIEQATTDILYGPYGASNKIMADALRRVVQISHNKCDETYLLIASEALANARVA